ncbi:unnamed protein product [Staurois parvus]|uniref:Uncharacterized protein n=1 Tax=Staurois parvus TaxID=386267 RepID=A0ABN9CTJ1_9NEOB|nr:unnamed protein product [Staurois parvus]
MSLLQCPRQCVIWVDAGICHLGSVPCVPFGTYGGRNGGKFENDKK